MDVGSPNIVLALWQQYLIKLNAHSDYIKADVTRTKFLIQETWYKKFVCV